MVNMVRRKGAVDWNAIIMVQAVLELIITVE